ncbi:hypothetical protein PENTCL1PPCAC_18662 [Pristionchus entomophagus]|uniref:Uncharacterized protein n=1 Tax=Pristionchus entomophagus TaxID=358040 RepID=A0AAV5TQF3_9BILA|nr:hypothetical protein PENTCL1PPCAC_18662 [Pristionchus entomophagus]
MGFKELIVRGRCCCGCAVTLGSTILATVSGCWAFCQMFTLIFFFDWKDGWFSGLCALLYCLVSMCASICVWQSIRTRREKYMRPMMLISIIHFVAFVIFLIMSLTSAFGGHTAINDAVEKQMNWCAQASQQCQESQNKMTKEDKQAYERSTAWYYVFTFFCLTILSVWVFFIHFSCHIKLIMTEEDYPIAHYHGDDDMTLTTFPAPAYDAAAAAAATHPALAYPGTPYDLPPSYTNQTATTADETPVKVPLP